MIATTAAKIVVQSAALALMIKRKERFMDDFTTRTFCRRSPADPRGSVTSDIC